MVQPVPHEDVVAPVVIYVTANPATPVPSASATPAPRKDDPATAALLTHLTRAEEFIAGLNILRLRDVEARVPGAEVRRREVARWWVVHEALLSVMQIVYVHGLDEVRRRFEWCVRS